MKATPRVITTSPARAKRYITPINQSNLVASYDHEGINDGCNSNAITFKGNPSATRVDLKSLLISSCAIYLFKDTLTKKGSWKILLLRNDHY